MEKIQFLIRALEKEQVALKRLIKEASKSREYLMAHFHTEALCYVNRSLQTLRNLEDKNADKKRFIRHMIRRLESQSGKESPERIREYLKKEIGQLKGEQQELEQQAKTGVAESLILNGYLDSLISKKIKNVRLYLNKSANFIIDIRRNRFGIKMLIPKLKELRKGFTIHDENLQHFLGMGLNWIRIKTHCHFYWSIRTRKNCFMN